MTTELSTGELILEQPLSEIYGGTHQTSLTTGDILYSSSANTFSKRVIGSAGTVFTSNGTVPDWATAGSIAIAYPDAIIDSNETTGGIVYANIASAISAGASNICIRANHTEPAVALSLIKNTSIRINDNVTLTIPTTGATITGAFELTLLGEGTISFIGLGTISISTTKVTMYGITFAGTTFTFSSAGVISAYDVVFDNAGLFTFGNNVDTDGVILSNSKFTTLGIIGTTSPRIQSGGKVSISGLSTVALGPQNLQINPSIKSIYVIVNSEFDELRSDTGTMLLDSNNIITLSFTSSISGLQMTNNFVEIFTMNSNLFSSTISNNIIGSFTINSIFNSGNLVFTSNVVTAAFSISSGKTNNVIISSNVFVLSFDMGDVDAMVLSNNVMVDPVTITIASIPSIDCIIVNNTCNSSFTITSSIFVSAFMNGWTISGNAFNGAFALTNNFSNQNSVISSNNFTTFSTTAGFDNSVFSNNFISVSSTFTGVVVDSNICNNNINGSITFSTDVSDTAITDNAIDVNLTQSAGTFNRNVFEGNDIGSNVTLAVSNSEFNTVVGNRINGTLTFSATFINSTINSNRVSTISFADNLVDCTISSNNVLASTISITGNTSNSVINGNVVRGGLSTGTTSGTNIVTSNRNGGVTTNFGSGDVIADNL